MSPRSYIHCFLGILIVAAQTHCVMGHGAELMQHAQIVQGADLPIGVPATCENESSCICKGATFPDTVDATYVESPWLVFSPLDGEVLQGAASATMGITLRASSEQIPSFRGTAARALLQSFQI